MSKEFTAHGPGPYEDKDIEASLNSMKHFLSRHLKQPLSSQNNNPMQGN